MSVINKMLRDLDSRNARATVKKEGVHSVPTQVVRDSRVVLIANGSVLKVLGVVGVIAVAAVGAWKSGVLDRFLAPAASPAPVTATAPSPAPVAVAAVAVPASAQVVPPPVAEPAASPKTPPVKAQPATPVAKAVPKPVVAASKAMPAVVAPLPKAAVPASSTPASSAPSSSAPSSSAPVEAQRQQAASEAIASAQSLWNAGNREAAINLLQDVLLSAERSMAANGTTRLGTGVVALVRELTRLQLADARPGSAWDLLVRMEPQVRNEADLWAVRGNAAQRMGRHTDSVMAYMAALQLRPGEQRWMLGAAVSLAALHKTQEAADMAGKAQALGPISREVQAYLRQMGVPLKD